MVIALELEMFALKVGPLTALCADDLMQFGVSGD
jgi:hypothetical protein